MIDWKALKDWTYTDRTLSYLPTFDLSKDSREFVEILSQKSNRKHLLRVPVHDLDMYRDIETMTFDGFFRQLGPWECYLNRLPDSWQWEIISFDESIKPIWDLSQETFEWQSQAAEGLFAKYPQLYEYTGEDDD